MFKLAFLSIFQFLQHRARNRLVVHQMYSNLTAYLIRVKELKGEVYFDLS